MRKSRERNYGFGGGKYAAAAYRRAQFPANNFTRHGTSVP